MRIAVAMALLSLLLAAPTAAKDPPYQSLLGKIVRARCHMDVCTWFSIEASSPVGKSHIGTLLQVTVKDWSSVHPDASYDRLTNRKLVAATDEYVFCSKTKPAVIYTAPDKPGWFAYRLSPDRPDKIFGYNEALYARYWAACHAVAIADVYDAGPKLAVSLGYAAVPSDSDEEQTLASPEAALLW